MLARSGSIVPGVGLGRPDRVSRFDLKCNDPCCWKLQVKLGNHVLKPANSRVMNAACAADHNTDPRHFSLHYKPPAAYAQPRNTAIASSAPRGECSTGSSQRNTNRAPVVVRWRFIGGPRAPRPAQQAVADPCPDPQRVYRALRNRTSGQCLGGELVGLCRDIAPDNIPMPPDWPESAPLHGQNPFNSDLMPRRRASRLQPRQLGQGP